MGASDEHDDPCRRADQCRGANIHLGRDEKHEHATAGERREKATNEFLGLHFIASQTPRERHHCRQFRKFRWLKPDAEVDPAARSETGVPDVGNEAQDEQDDRDAIPDLPGFLQEMVVEQGCQAAEHQAHSEPSDLPAEEEHRLALAFSRKGGGARHHDEPKDDQPQNGDD